MISVMMNIRKSMAIFPTVTSRMMKIRRSLRRKLPSMCHRTSREAGGFAAEATKETFQRYWRSVAESGDVPFARASGFMCQKLTHGTFLMFSRPCAACSSSLLQASQWRAKESTQPKSNWPSR